MPRGKKKTGGGTADGDPPEEDEPGSLDAGEDDDNWEASYATEGLDLDESESALAADLEYSGLTASDVMVSEVITVRLETSIEEVSELFQIHNIHGAPVVDNEGMLVGIVTEDDVMVGGMGFSDEELDTLEDEDGEEAGQEAAAAAAAEPAVEPDVEPAVEGDPVDETRRVEEIMTPRPITAEEHTPVEELCRLMWKLKIHRIPIVNQGRVRGIVSTIDICRLVVEGRARLIPSE
jgi:CBS domain-containing protein